MNHHWGNCADVIKHVFLTEWLPGVMVDFELYIETHAGSAIYDAHSDNRTESQCGYIELLNACRLGKLDNDITQSRYVRELLQLNANFYPSEAPFYLGSPGWEMLLHPQGVNPSLHFFDTDTTSVHNIDKFARKSKLHDKVVVSVEDGIVGADLLIENKADHDRICIFLDPFVHDCNTANAIERWSKAGCTVLFWYPLYGNEKPASPAAPEVLMGQLTDPRCKRWEAVWNTSTKCGSEGGNLIGAGMAWFGKSDNPRNRPTTILSLLAEWLTNLSEPYRNVECVPAHLSEGGN
jgi:23S rRNA A2030 N6-methylase RlmJ